MVCVLEYFKGKWEFFEKNVVYYPLNIISLPLNINKGSFIDVKDAEWREDKYTETGGV